MAPHNSTKAALECTTKYELFTLLPFNRDVDKIKELESSMKEHGFIPAYPLHVIRDGQRLNIKAGHHRFTVAKALGIPLFYVVCNDTATIHQLEKSSRKWSMTDYLHSFSRMGDPDYIQVERYHKMTGIPILACLSLFAGEAGHSHNQDLKFKSGEYAVKNTVTPQLVWQVVQSLSHVKPEWAKTSMCVSSISRVVIAGQIDINRLISKIKKYGEILDKKTSIPAYTDMWEEVYNYKSSGNRVPLAFIVNESMRRRSAVYKAA